MNIVNGWMNTLLILILISKEIMICTSLLRTVKDTFYAIIYFFLGHSDTSGMMMTFVLLAVSSTNDEVQLTIAESSRVLKKDQEKVLTNMLLYMYMYLEITVSIKFNFLNYD